LLSPCPLFLDDFHYLRNHFTGALNNSGGTTTWTDGTLNLTNSSLTLGTAGTIGTSLATTSTKLLRVSRADQTLNVTGNLTKGGGAFKIDHPLDPENKYLYHSFVESPDMKNVYDGIVILNARGEGWVELPDWFEALNRDFRYQLTAVGAAMPRLHVAQEIEGNRFPRVFVSARTSDGLPELRRLLSEAVLRRGPDQPSDSAELHEIPL
jgi:hypothetical protein